ncbi:MAG: hydroxyacid dehydrogenase [Candidatus Anstonellaceae archaeon]
MKIVISDQINPQTIEELKKFGEVVFRPENLFEELKTADILIVRSATKVDKKLLQVALRLKYIIRGGVGLDNIDLEECKKRKIEVLNTPEASTNSVAELTIGLIFCLLRNIPFLHQKLTIENKWEKNKGMGAEIENKNLGIIGMGRIGQAVAKKAKALGMEVYYYDKTDKNLEYKFLKNLEDLLSICDIITIHASSNPSDGPILKKEHFQKMKDGAFLLNLSRGFAIDEDALLEALTTGKLKGAALDVFSSEPYFGPLIKLDNVVLTPHIGASTYEAQERIGQEIIKIVKNIFISKKQ